MSVCQMKQSRLRIDSVRHMPFELYLRCVMVLTLCGLSSSGSLPAPLPSPHALGGLPALAANDTVHAVPAGS